MYGCSLRTVIRALRTYTLDLWYVVHVRTLKPVYKGHSKVKLYSIVELG